MKRWEWFSYSARLGFPALRAAARSFPRSIVTRPCPSPVPGGSRQYLGEKASTTPTPPCCVCNLWVYSLLRRRRGGGMEPRRFPTPTERQQPLPFHGREAIDALGSAVLPRFSFLGVLGNLSSAPQAAPRAGLSSAKRCRSVPGFPESPARSSRCREP